MSRAARAAQCITAAVAVTAALSGCRRDAPPEARSAGSDMAAGAASPGSGAPCVELPFADATPVPEASGAAWTARDGAPALLVIGDSGNDGAYAIVDPESGATLEQGELPLGGGGESGDLEGVAARGGKLFVITSPGWMRVYERRDGGFALLEGPYALGPIDLDESSGPFGDRSPKGRGMVCAADRTNCGRNYEGVCLAPGPVPGRCVGFAAAKADGHLYCLVESGGKLHVEYAQSIKIARPGTISDCAFTDDGRLYVGANAFDAGHVYRVTGWEDPAGAEVTRVASLLVGFPETLAVRGDVFYVMSDIGRAPSHMKKFRCPGR